MQFFIKKSIFIFLILFCTYNITLAQDNTDTTSKITSNKKLCVGAFIGTYFANKYATEMYNGYGFNQDGVANDFSNSFLNNQILYNYGGYRGGTDFIAQALNVNHTDWTFTQQDMPGALKYNITYQVGLALRYNLKKSGAIIFNIEATKLTVNGKFTIGTIARNNGIAQPSTVYQGTIIGQEQRLQFNLGYHKVLGDNEKLNFFIEGGLNIVMSKVLSHQAFIKSANNNSGDDIAIDLLSYYTLPGFEYTKAKYLTGVGIGAFAGAGIVLTFNPKYTIQLVYNPSYDKINLGATPKFQLNHSAGLRFYYNL
jgi:hypothetical protein